MLTEREHAGIIKSIMKCFRTITSKFSLLASIVLFFLIALPTLPSARVQAATNWVDGGYDVEMYNARKTGSVSQSPYAARTFDTPLYRIIEFILGAIEGITVPVGISQKDPGYVQELNQKSAVAGISNVIIAMYANPPADLALWIQDTGQTLGFLPKQAYAQGVGFSGLAPLLPIWKAFRNIAYLLLAIVMIVIGFMVMLRKKIDPKTVVTVQNALPRIVITLLLITFSYAIVGIMIDLMYLLILFSISIVGQSGIFPAQDISTYQAQLMGGNLGTLFNFVFFKGGWAAYLELLPAVLVGVFGGIGAGAAIGAIAAAFFSLTLGVGTVAAIGAIVGGVLIILLLSIILLFTLFRIFYMLLMAYISIVLSLILAPLQLLIEAFPGGNGFNGWFRNLLSNILVFPATAILLLLASSFTKLETTGIWAPPLLLGGGTGVAIPGLLALGVLLLIPTIANAIKDALKPPEFKYGGAPAQAITSVLGFPVSFIVGMGQTAFTHALYTRGQKEPEKRR